MARGHDCAGRPAAGAAVLRRLGAGGLSLSRAGTSGDEPEGAGSDDGSARRAADGARLAGSADDACAARAAAPVRLDFAGGWTDVPPFSAREGGTVVAAAIGLYARAEVSARRSRDSGSSPTTSARPAEVSDHVEARARRAARPALGRGAPASRRRPARCKPTRDAPPGSGLGSSGALDVALVAALAAARARVARRERDRRPGLPARVGRGRASPEEGRISSSLDLRRLSPPPLSATPAPRSSRSVSTPRSPTELERRMILCYTGASRFSGGTITRVMQAYERGDRKVTGALQAAARRRRADGRGAEPARPAGRRAGC